MKFEHIISTVKQSGYDGVPGYGILSKSRNLPHSDFKEYTCSPGRIKRDVYSYEYRNKTAVFTKRTPKNDVYLSDGVHTDNSITHTVLCKKESEALPCEYIASPSFISNATQDSVTFDSGTDYLDETEFFPSGAVSVNRVMNFLGTQGRVEAYKKLLYAVLKADDKEKPIVICDTDENIPLWIGAVSYSLPRHIAVKLSFTTSVLPYSGAPFYRLCGICADDINESVADYIRENSFCLFDMIHLDLPDYPVTDPIFGFFADAMTHSYADIAAFHDFVASSFYTISEAQLTNAYAAYNVVRKGIANVSYREFATAAHAVSSFGFDSAFIQIAESCLFSGSAVCEYDEAYIAAILLFICGRDEILSYKLKSSLREFICRVSLAVICTKENGGEKLNAYYEKASVCAESVGICLSEKLLSDKYRKHIINTLSASTPDYKAQLVSKMYKEYLKAKGFGCDDITSGSESGSFVAEYIKASSQHCESCSVFMLNETAYDPLVLCAVYLVIEEALGENEKQVSLAKNTLIALASKSDRTAKIYDFLVKADHDELTYEIFKTKLASFRDHTEAVTAFDEHDKKYFSSSEEYASRYLVSALEILTETARESFPDDLEKTYEYILRVTCKHRVCIKYSDEICKELADSIPVEPDKKESEILQLISVYVQSVCCKPLDGRLLCLCFAKQLDGIEDKRDFDKAVPTLDKYTSSRKVPLNSLDKKEYDDYMDWIIPNLASFLPEYEDLCAVYSYFEFNTDTEELYIKELIKSYIKESKGDGDYRRLCGFLRFVITECTETGKRSAGAQVTKLNAKNMDSLKACGEDVFGDDNTMYLKFRDILDTEPEKGSIFKKLFGRK